MKLKPLSERRKEYTEQLAQILTSKLSHARVLSSTSGPDPARTVPGRYARLILRVGGERVLAIGVNEKEAQAEIDGVIAAGLIWLANYNQSRDSKELAKQLWFCLPRRRSETVLERLTWISVTHLGARIECFEIDEGVKTFAPAQPAIQADLIKAHPQGLKWPAAVQVKAHPQGLKWPAAVQVKAHPWGLKWPAAVPAQTSPQAWRERILSLAPELIETRTLANGISFSIHGLEFARVLSGETPRVNFGLFDLFDPFEKIDPHTRGKSRALSESNFTELDRLVGQIIEFRTAQTPDRRHPFYRLRSEAWLESLLRRRITDLDLTFDERYVYSQVPAWRANERSVIDLLTINHQSRLVVIEIKAAEDLQLPLQGLDYWLRVEQARASGEFERRGLFAGVKLADQSPLLYLVAPRLRFHRAFKLITRCLAPEIEAYQIGVNANWRAGVRIHSKEKLSHL